MSYEAQIILRRTINVLSKLRRRVSRIQTDAGRKQKIRMDESASLNRLEKSVHERILLCREILGEVEQ